MAPSLKKKNPSLNYLFSDPLPKPQATTDDLIISIVFRSQKAL